MQELVKEYGSEFDWESNYEYLNASHIHPLFKGAQYFRSGRDALIAIALRHKEYCKKILLPALCCESMVVPFLENGYEVLFYKLNPDFSADFKDILSKMQSDTIFLYMSYFGSSSLDSQKINYIQSQFENVILIEDRTQDILAKRPNDYVPDYTVCSIRKWIAIPDGGLLWSSNQDNFPKEKDTYFGDVRLRAMINKSEYLKEANAEMKIKFRNELSIANHYLDKNEIVADISKKSHEILKCIDFEKIYKQRKKMFCLYPEILKILRAQGIYRLIQNKAHYIIRFL